MWLEKSWLARKLLTASALVVFQKPVTRDVRAFEGLISTSLRLTK
jgi:hypothetical protein